MAKMHGVTIGSMPLVVLHVIPPREARFDVLLKGKKAGVATYRLSDRPGGGRVTRLRIVLADGSVSESLSLSDSQGQAVRSEDVVRRSGAYRKESVAYDSKGNATVTLDKAKPYPVPFDRRGSRKDPSETWFRGVKPSPGTWAVFRKLDPRRRLWEEVRVTYVGARGGGHLVTQKGKKSLTSFTLDGTGMLLSFESGGVRLVRR